jgi:glycosyltransferase involved in cell wall biosynthesis
MRKIKILHVVVRLSMGGIEKWLANLLESYNRDQFEMEICCVGLREELGELAVQVKESGTEIHFISIRNPFRFLSKLRQLNTKKNYDIMFCHLTFLPVLIFGKMAGIRNLIEMYHNTLPPDDVREKSIIINLFIKLRWINAWLCKKIIGCSETTLDSFFPNWRSQNDKFITLHYGIPVVNIDRISARKAIREELGISPHAYVIGHVGRFVPQKNHEAFVKAAKEIQQLVPDIQFILVGDGILRKKIEDMVSELSLSNAFHFLGIRNDVPAIMCAMDLAFYPSFHEGSPLTFIEAQMFGLPVVTGQRPELVESICPENHRYTNIDLDDLKEVAIYMNRLISDPSKLNQISLSGAEWAYKNFSIQRSTENLEKILLSVVAASK